MNIAVTVLAATGTGVVCFAATVLLLELARSVRQSTRVAYAGARITGLRKPSFEYRLYAFRREFGAGYSSLQLGVWVIPRDPSKPISRVHYY